MVFRVITLFWRWFVLLWVVYDVDWFCFAGFSVVVGVLGSLTDLMLLSLFAYWLATVWILVVWFKVFDCFACWWLWFMMRSRLDLIVVRRKLVWLCFIGWLWCFTCRCCFEFGCLVVICVCLCGDLLLLKTGDIRIWLLGLFNCCDLLFELDLFASCFGCVNDLA